MKCPEETHRINCGCCDEVKLDCTLDQGHDGPHLDGSLRGNFEHLAVSWEYEPGWKAGRIGAEPWAETAAVPVTGGNG